MIFPQQKREVANLKMENIPEIPFSIEEASRQYRNTRSASCRSWLPDGEGMIIGTRFGETSQLHLLNEPLGVRNQITFFNEPVRGGYPCPKSEFNGFLFSKDIGKYYKITPDERDLNYDQYFSKGTKEKNLHEYNSNNTSQLSVDEMKKILLDLPEIRIDLNN